MGRALAACREALHRPEVVLEVLVRVDAAHAVGRAACVGRAWRDAAKAWWRLQPLAQACATALACDAALEAPCGTPKLSAEAARWRGAALWALARGGAPPDAVRLLDRALCSRPEPAAPSDVVEAAVAAAVVAAKLRGVDVLETVDALRAAADALAASDRSVPLEPLSRRRVMLAEAYLLNSLNWRVTAPADEAPFDELVEAAADAARMKRGELPKRCCARAWADAALVLAARDADHHDRFSRTVRAAAAAVVLCERAAVDADSDEAVHLLSVVFRGGGVSEDSLRRCRAQIARHAPACVSPCPRCCQAGSAAA